MCYIPVFLRFSFFLGIVFDGSVTLLQGFIESIFSLITSAINFVFESLEKGKVKKNSRIL